MSTFVADIETKAVMEETLVSERAKAEEANALEGENDPWSMWGLSKKSTKKKKAKKRDTSCHDAPRCDAPADTSPTAVVEDSATILGSEIKRSIASKHVQDATETRTREVSFSNRNSSRSQVTKIPNTKNIKSESVGFPGLHSSKSTRRLEQIADLRARGIGDHIDLPQLIVCGDQSAGKSSVLEGLTGLPFPRQDGVCTKFATEIILQHSIGEQSITATILPSSSRSERFKIMLRRYRRQLQEFDELPVAIAEAGSLMGIRGFGDVKEGPAFAEDVLRIEVLGPVGLHLTVVDLPGLISVANEEQTEDDVQTVQGLVDSYVANPRTIILAVVQAGNDIANQGIIQKSRRVDKAGQRTVGVITKPDLINQGTEKRIALLAKNLDTTKLKLGYFLVKNPTPTELASGITPEQRQRGEVHYFQSSPWKEQALSMDRVGILSLRSYLQSLLDQHIERELPKVREEVKLLMKKTEVAIEALGEERPTTGHLRMFLSRLAMRFHGLTASALNGTYHEMDSVFFSDHDNDKHSTRLRALVHLLNTDFSDHMRQNGQKRKVIERELNIDCDVEDVPEDGQLLVTKSEMEVWVKEVSSPLARFQRDAQISRYTSIAEERNCPGIITMCFYPSFSSSSLAGGTRLQRIIWIICMKRSWAL